MNSSTNKKNSIIEYLTDKNTDDINSLKEFLEALKKQEEPTATNLDENYIKKHIKLVLESCVHRSSGPNSTVNKKNELAFKVIELMSANSKQLTARYKLNQLFAPFLDKSYFEKLTALFQSNYPEHALKVTKNLIGILGKTLHPSLTIINPLLQIIESAFKHTNSEIKSSSYDCWSCLIDNFGLDNDFLLKPKKFSLLLMPLLYKCKSYKEEDVCRSKILAWLNLIENVNQKLPEHLSKLVIPFFNFSFGLSSLTDSTSNDQDVKSKKYIQNLISSDFKPEHSLEKLNQLGFEFYFSLLFNGNLNWLSEDLLKKLQHVNPNKDYNIYDTLTDTISWFHLVKYYFQIFIPKLNTSFDGVLLYFIWIRFCNLLKLTYKDESEDTAASLNEYNHDLVPKIQKKDLVQLESEDLNELVGCFLMCSIELVKNTTVNTNKNTNDSKFIIQLTKSLTAVLSNEYVKCSLMNNKNIDFKTETLKMIKKATKLLFVNEEENTSLVISRMGSLLKLTESHKSLLELYNWLEIATKFYEHLKSIKTKSNVINLTEAGYESITLCIMYPFKHYKHLEIQETDLKLINSAYTNILKALSGLIKQNRIKLDDQQKQTFKFKNMEHIFKNVNNWSLSLFSNLSPKQPEEEQQSLFKDWSDDSDATNLPSHANIAEDTLKYLQLQAQFSLHVLQNIFEFEIVNQQKSDSGGNDIQSNISIMKNFSQQSKDSEISSAQNGKSKQNEVNVYSQLIELIQSQIKQFYEFISSHVGTLKDEEKQENSNSNNEIETTQTQSTEEQNQKVENKQAIQLYCNLIEQLSVLFTRIKSYDLLGKFLISFSPSIELLSKLNALSKQITHQTSQPSTEKHRQSLNPNHHLQPHQNQQINILFQSTRRSSDLYDTFSMQIASYIQNNLNKTYFQHEFDSSLLSKLEPVFYSFLKYFNKLSLKQKTLQAWNGTFGKSVDERLVYSKRLEKLFIEIREEMIQNSRHQNGNTSASSTGSLIALSLPGLKPIDDAFLLQSTTTTNASFQMNDEIEHEQEENKENSGGDKIQTNTNSNKFKSQISSQLKESLLNDSSSSVPMVQLYNMKNIPATIKSLKEALKSPVANAKDILPTEPASQVITTNFVFSPAGRNSFVNTISTTKPSQILSKTPEPTGRQQQIARQSPRSLRHNSKRKLDLNGLIDQMPDKDFVEISNNKMPICNLLNKFESYSSNKRSSLQPTRKANETIENNQSMSATKTSKVLPKFKQPPLTEHQKEMKRKKSFIPIEMQSVCDVELDTQTMDSQMSCTADGFEDTNNTNQSNMYFTKNAVDKKEETVKSLKNDSSGLKVTPVISSIENDENANDKMDLEHTMNQTEHITQIKTDADVVSKETNSCDALITDDESSSMSIKETEKASDKIEAKAAPANATPTIRFQSKINPKKQIELVEVNFASKPEEVPKSVEPNELIKLEPNKTDETDNVILGPSQSSQVKNNNELDQVLSPSRASDSENSNKRRSARLKSKDTTNYCEIETKNLSDEIKNDLSKSLTNLSPKISENNQKSSKSEEISENKANNKQISKIKRLKLKNKLIAERNKNNILRPIKKLNMFKVNCNYKLSVNMSNNLVNQRNRRRKMKKFKKLIRGLKKNNTKRDNDSMFKHSSELEKIKNSPQVSKEAKIEEAKVKFDLEPVVTKDVSDNDEDDLPLSKIVTNKKVLENKNNNLPSDIISEASVNESAPSLPINKLLADKMSTESSSSPSTPIVTRSLTASSNSAIQSSSKIAKQLNGTPNSILKKRTSRISNQADSLGDLVSVSNKMNNDLAGPNTPTQGGKRRVSFCESVQIEEIEPNFNKSFNRLTPRLQNRAKLIFSPYFNSKQQQKQLLENSASPSSSSSSNVSTTTITSSQTTKLILDENNQKTSTTESVTTIQCSNSTIPSSIQAASASIPSSTTLNSSKLINNSTNQSSKLNPLLLSPNPSNLTSNIIGNSMMMPNSPGNGSSSLINMFSNIKSNFLSQRSTIIQQQMLQNQLNKSELGSPSNSRVLPSSFQNAEPKQPVYPKLKDSNVLINELIIRLNSNGSINSYFDGKLDLVELLKSINILTIGDLCSLTANEILKLPLKLPKMASFISLMQAYEENILSNKNEQTTAKLNEVLTKTSSSSLSSTSSTSSIMGSVEEEMAKLEKLESNNCLDTSIESEAFNELQKNNNTNNLTITNVTTTPTTSMEIDLTTNENSSQKSQEIKEVKLVEDKKVAIQNEDDVLDRFKSYLGKNDDEFNLDNLSMNEMFALSEYIENVEEKLIQVKRKLRLQIMKHNKS